MTSRVPEPRGLLGGGTDGNEILTTVTGVVLIVILAVVGLTIVRIGQLLQSRSGQSLPLP